MPVQKPTRPARPPAPSSATATAEPRGIQSIEVGGQLLRALAHHGRPLPLKLLAAEAGMPPAKAHPYLVSFGRLGLVEREADTGHYGLGPLALQMGLIALHQYDPVRLATPVVEALARQTGHTAAIAVWGDRGPTIVRIAEGPAAVHVSMRHGAVMSIPGTASGRLFAAYGPREAVAAALAEEARVEATRGRRAPLDADPAGSGFGARPRVRGGKRQSQTPDEADLAQVRAQGLACVDGLAVPGIRAMAAPVFDARGALVVGLTAIGPAATFDLAVDGPVGVALKTAAAELSQRLGWRGVRESGAGR